MGIDRLSSWLTKFGYGQYTGIDLAEERSGLMPTREWKLKRYKNRGIRATPFRWASSRGYWTATPIQMAKALNT
ncbi:penicillin-binding transpeptidase domain-containing protein [Serratia ureilytica]